MAIKLPAVIAISLFPAFLNAQSDRGAQDIAEYLGGQRLFITTRDGGPVYGTYIFMDVHFCPSGKYMSFGQNRKQTVMGNEQVSNWEDRGVWDIASARGQVVLRYASVSGKRDAVPVELLPNGGIWFGERVSVQRRGRAQCR